MDPVSPYHDWREDLEDWPANSDWHDAVQRTVVHIVGGGIAGLTLAATLDPDLFEVHVFEAMLAIGEAGYGFNVGPALMHICRDKLGVTGLDLSVAKALCIRPHGQAFTLRPPSHPDKGAMRRSHLVARLLARVNERHPGCIRTGLSCIRVRFQRDGRVETTFASPDDTIMRRVCDLVVGADGVNSAVRKYVSLAQDTKAYGQLAAYRFIVPQPSEWLLERTSGTVNMCIGHRIHSPSYRVDRREQRPLTAPSSRPRSRQRPWPTPRPGSSAVPAACRLPTATVGARAVHATGPST